MRLDGPEEYCIAVYMSNLSFQRASKICKLLGSATVTAAVTATCTATVTATCTATVTITYLLTYSDLNFTL